MLIEDLNFLVVDDMLTMRRIITQYLTQKGAKSITGAGGGLQALDLLAEAEAAQCPFNVILCDWHMADLSGFELAKKCRAHPAYKDAAFIMLTSENDVQNVVNAMLLGVDDYILKPLVPGVFFEKLEKVLKKRFKTIIK